MSSVYDDINRFLSINKLKFTYRLSWRTINWEKESVAAHCWWCQVVADYLLHKLDILAPNKYALDRLKIYQLIVYHDLIEAEVWDIDLDPTMQSIHKNKNVMEKEALPIFLEKIPKEIKYLYKWLIEEYEHRITLESKFVKLVDVIEAEFQCFFNKDLFLEWTEEYYIEKREKHFDYFPELKYIYDDVLDYFKINNYFKKTY